LTWETVANAWRERRRRRPEREAAQRLPPTAQRHC
jgi:hypothetical protein